MKHKFGILGLGVFIGLAFTLAGWAYISQSYTFKGSLIDPPMPAADFELTDQHGQVFRLREQRGKVVLLFFGYTHCPDVCPATLSEYKQIKEQLGERAEQVRFVFISVDPERDSAEFLLPYLANFDPVFVGLTGPRAELEPVWEAYYVYQGKVETGSAGGYLVDHSSRVYAIDTMGNLRLTYSFGTEPSSMVQDIGQLLREN